MGIGALASILDFLFGFPLGEILIELILVVGVMCVVTDGIAQARNRGDESDIEVVGETDFSPDEIDAAYEKINSLHGSIEFNVERIVANCRSVKTQEEAIDTPDGNSRLLPETDRLQLRVVKHGMDRNTSTPRRLCTEHDKNILTQCDNSPLGLPPEKTSTCNKEIPTYDFMLDNRMDIDFQADRNSSNECRCNTFEDLKLKSNNFSFSHRCYVEEYPTFNGKFSLHSSICESEEARRLKRDDNDDTSQSGFSRGIRPETEGRCHQRMIADGAADAEQVELLIQDRDSIRLWNEMILEDNARLDSENKQLRLENDEMIQENTRLTKENVQHTQFRFQIVFVGDSGVGKTSFIRRVCDEKFSPRFSSTVGVDFHSKTLDVGGRQVNLQMWDTAGQERFRSMTRQYFRKADGAVVMYDVTSADSFKNVRNWIHDAQEGSADAAVFAIIGHKRDLVANDSSGRQVTRADGEELAKASDAVFYETSAKTGENIELSLLAIASLLVEKKQLNRSLSSQSIVRLDKSRQQFVKGSCCGTNRQPSI